jgi:RNA polymerase sigma-70 factor (ECF subfamily)
MRDDSTFEAFIFEHQDMVYTTALRLLRNESDAQDIAQEVFLRAYRDFEMLRANDSAGAWLRTVARNLSLNQLTRYRSRWKLFTDFFHSEDSDVEPDFLIQTPADTETADPSGALDLVRKVLLTLPDKQRVPLVLYHYEELSYLEIAEALKIPLSQVKTDIHRGREALKRKIMRLRGEADTDCFPPRQTHPAPTRFQPRDVRPPFPGDTRYSTPLQTS